jgi:Rap1a immunity proteins
MRRILIVILLMSVSLPVYSLNQYLNGNQLLSDCKEIIKIAENDPDYRPMPAGRCHGYIISASDVHNAYAEWGHMKPTFCKPDGITSGQLVRIVMKWMEAHSESLHLAASSLVINAFNEVFPCQG